MASLMCIIAAYHQFVGHFTKWHEGQNSREKSILSFIHIYDVHTKFYHFTKFWELIMLIYAKTRHAKNDTSHENADS